MNSIEIILISNSTDFTTDYVAVELERRNANYLRLNRDHFDSYNISLDVLNANLEVEIQGEKYICSYDNVKSIYYRAPTFLRDNYKPGLSIEKQLYRTQWSAFVRNLAIFDKARWMNEPVATYRAENKFLQLRTASKVGFECPKTYVSNVNVVPNELTDDSIVVKSIDTAVMRYKQKELFVYTNVIDPQELQGYENTIAPFFIQTCIQPKIDIRVTVVDNKVFPVAILKKGEGVDGDWRVQKEDLEYKQFQLPNTIKEQCIELVGKLSLNFGGIDLVLSDGRFYFIEINPTGEWAWLLNKAGIEVQRAIGDVLCG